jgi:hypothetical protein
MTRTFGLAALVAFLIPGLTAAAPALRPAKRIDPKVRELRLEQIRALKEQLEGQFERVKIGKDPLVVFLEAVRKLAEAEVDIAETREAELAALSNALRLLTVVEGQMEELQNAGLQTGQGVAQVRAARLEAEIQLEKWKKR